MLHKSSRKKYVFFFIVIMKSDGRSKIPTTLTTEWDENILFDFDDPDLRSANNAGLQVLNTFMLKGKFIY